MVGEVATGPDRSVQVVVTASGVIALTYGLVRFGYGLYLPTFMAQFALSRVASGSIAAGSFAGYSLAALLAYRLVRRGQARRALWGAAGLAAAGALLVAAAWSSASLACGVVTAGSGAGLASPALVAAVAATVAQDRADRAQAVVNSGTGIGVVVAAVLVTLAPSGWRPTWAGFAVAVVLGVWATDRATAWPAARAAGSGPGTRAASTARLVLLLRRPALGAVLAGAGSASVWTFGQDLLTTSTGASAGARTALWGVLGAAAVLGAASGDAVRRLGVPIAWTSMVTVAAAATLTLPHARSVALAAVALAGFGGAYVALSGVLIAWGERLAPHAPAQATAVLFIALAAGQALGALLLGLLAAGLSLATGFTAAAGLLLASATTARRTAACVPTGSVPAVGSAGAPSP